MRYTQIVGSAVLFLGCSEYRKLQKLEFSNTEKHLLKKVRHNLLLYMMQKRKSVTLHTRSRRQE